MLQQTWQRTTRPEGRASCLRKVAGGWRLMTHPEAAPYVEQFVLSSRHARLTKASLETLAVVAYKQPVTRHQVSSIRGVDSDGVLRALVERGPGPGGGSRRRAGPAVLYGTTTEFLERLGLASLADLPPLAPLLADAGAGTARRTARGPARGARPAHCSPGWPEGPPPQESRTARQSPSGFSGPWPGLASAPAVGRGPDPAGPGPRRRTGRPRLGDRVDPSRDRGLRGRRPGPGSPRACGTSPSTSRRG